MSLEPAAPMTLPAEPTHEEKLQQQLAEQLQLPGLDTSAPAVTRAPAPQPALEHAKVQPPPSTAATAVFFLV